MNIKICGRSKGQSAIAASAFRSGEKLKDYETGQTFNYPEKEGIVFSEVCLCDNATAEYSDRETLWNAVHKVDHRSYKRQGIDKIPTIHEGYTAREIAARGGTSERIEINKEIQERNALLQKNAEKQKKIESKLSELEMELKEDDKTC